MKFKKNVYLRLSWWWFKRKDFIKSGKKALENHKYFKHQAMKIIITLIHQCIQSRGIDSYCAWVQFFHQFSRPCLNDRGQGDSDHAKKLASYSLRLTWFAQWSRFRPCWRLWNMCPTWKAHLLTAFLLPQEHRPCDREGLPLMCKTYIQCQNILITHPKWQWSEFQLQVFKGSSEGRGLRLLGTKAVGFMCTKVGGGRQDPKHEVCRGAGKNQGASSGLP